MQVVLNVAFGTGKQMVQVHQTQDGSTASTVSANTTAGFSMFKFTGTNGNTTVGHGLGASTRNVYN